MCLPLPHRRRRPCPRGIRERPCPRDSCWRWSPPLLLFFKGRRACARTPPATPPPPPKTNLNARTPTRAHVAFQIATLLAGRRGGVARTRARPPKGRGGCQGAQRHFFYSNYANNTGDRRPAARCTHTHTHTHTRRRQATDPGRLRSWGAREAAGDVEEDPPTPHHHQNPAATHTHCTKPLSLLGRASPARPLRLPSHPHLHKKNERTRAPLPSV